MDLLPFLGLLAVLLIKEAGVPVPVPGDLLVLGAGVAAAGSGLAAPVQLGAILLAGYAGGSVQFAVVRGTLQERFLRLLGRLGVPEPRIAMLTAWLRQRGAKGVAIARATPGLRVGAIAASGLAGLGYGVFLRGLIAGNTVFVGGHFGLGFLVGAPALGFVAASGGTALALGGIVVLAALGAVGWVLIRRRARRAATSSRGVHQPSVDSGVSLAGFGAWAEAACPACLAITIAGDRTAPGGLAMP